MKKFNLEYQYSLFLTRMGLHEERMNPVQRVQIKQTFMGTVGQLLILLRDDVGSLDEKEGTETLDSLLNQIMDYFKVYES